MAAHHCYSCEGRHGLILRSDGHQVVTGLFLWHQSVSMFSAISTSKPMSRFQCIAIFLVSLNGNVLWLLHHYKWPHSHIYLESQENWLKTDFRSRLDHAGKDCKFPQTIAQQHKPCKFFFHPPFFSSLRNRDLYKLEKSGVQYLPKLVCQFVLSKITAHMSF